VVGEWTLIPVSALALVTLLQCASARAGEIAPDDFRFDGPIGSAGAKVEKVGRDDFKITLGPGPKNPGWPNHLQFQIVRNCKGNAPHITAVYPVETGYGFFENFGSWSYDGKDWRETPWVNAKTVKNPDGNTKTQTAEIVFPVLEQDTVWFGWQIPMSYEDMKLLVAGWQKNPAVKVVVVGQSLGKRDLIRLEITDPNSPQPRTERWVHYFANQHPGEFNSMWRMAAMIDWLLSDAGADARKRFVCHFIIMMSPDGPSAGWHRTNAQGIDMNRSYAREGANPGQGHEPYLWQKDLEGIMASDCPAIANWSMHTCLGLVDPSMIPGPETDGLIGPPSEFAEILLRLDPNHALINPLKYRRKMKPLSQPWTPAPADAPPRLSGGGGYWDDGPGKQFGMTNVLVEGGGSLFTKKENLDSGVVLIRAIAEYYSGTKGEAMRKAATRPASAPATRPAKTQATDAAS
jgi:hypothetical protein